jgi:hypothetical protein
MYIISWTIAFVSTSTDTVRVHALTLLQKTEPSICFPNFFVSECYGLRWIRNPCPWAAGLATWRRGVTLLRCRHRARSTGQYSSASVRACPSARMRPRPVPPLQQALRVIWARTRHRKMALTVVPVAVPFLEWSQQLSRPQPPPVRTISAHRSHPPGAGGGIFCSKVIGVVLRVQTRSGSGRR